MQNVRIESIARSIEVFDLVSFITICSDNK